MDDMTEDSQSSSRASALGGAALGALLDEAASLRPDELASAARRHAELLGLAGATTYLADKEQRSLLPFPATAGDPVAIEGTMAGRAYQRNSVVTSESDAGDVNVWVPLLHGAHRVGVLEARAPDADPARLTAASRFAALVGQLLMAKADYGDNILTAMRQREISLAAEMRWALLPPLTFIGPDVAVAGYLEPAYRIAGDTFDYAMNDNLAHIAIFDARGHGLTASRIANLALLSYRHSRRAGRDLQESYQAMDEVIREELQDEAFATAQLGRLDLADGVFTWVNAGHPPPLLLRGGRSAQELASSPDIPVGFEGGVPTLNETGLEPGDVVAFYSDGITEARSSDGEAFGVDRLSDFLIRAAASDESPPETVRRLVHSIIDRQGGSVADDATVVLLKWTP